MAENRETLRKYFGVDVYLGSLNVDIYQGPANLHQELDRAHPTPAFTIPREELRSMSSYLGDGQAWRARLSAARIPQPHDCWLFRRVGSKVPRNIIELVSVLPLVHTYVIGVGEQERGERVSHLAEQRDYNRAADGRR